MAKRKKRPGRRKAELVLADEDRTDLERYARGRTVSHGLAVRARIVLVCAEGKDNVAVGRDVGVTAQTVGRWRRRFIARGIGGLMDLARPNVHRKLSDDRVEEVIHATLETLPAGSTHWSTRKMAKRAGVSRSSVSRIWRAFKLKPHREDTFTLSNDDFFVEKVATLSGST
jgi:transposase